MEDIQSKILDIKRRITEEKIKWGFTEDYQLSPKISNQEIIDIPKEEISTADDLKAKLLSRKKIK